MQKKQCLQIERMPPDNNVCQKRFTHFFELMYLYPTNYLRKKLIDLISKKVNATVIFFSLKSRFIFKVSLKL